MQAIPILLFALLLAVPLAAQQEALQRLSQEAQAAQASGDLTAAIHKYEQIVQLQPQMAEAQANLGVLYYRQGDTLKARQVLQKAAALNPRLAGPFFYLGVIALEKGSPVYALQQLRRADSLQPANPLTLSYMGYALAAEKKNEPAFRSLSSAVEAGANDPNVLFSLSTASSNLAEQAFAVLEKRFASSPYTQLKRAHFREAKRDWREAARFYRAASAGLPHEAALSRKLIWIESQSDRARSSPSVPAADDLSDGSLQFLYHPPEYTTLSQLLRAKLHAVSSPFQPSSMTAEDLYRSGETYQSISFLASLFLTSRYPESFRAHQLQGKMLATQSRTDEAIAEYKRAIELQPDAPDLHFALGNLYWEQGRFDDAQPELEQELKANPNQPYCLYELGDIAYRDHRLSEAERDLLHSVALRPSLREAQLALAKVYEAESQPGKAVACLRQAVALDPSDPAAHYSLMVIFKREKQESEAARELSEYRVLKAQADAAIPQVTTEGHP